MKKAKSQYYGLAIFITVQLVLIICFVLFAQKTYANQNQDLSQIQDQDQKITVNIDLEIKKKNKLYNELALAINSSVNKKSDLNIEADKVPKGASVIDSNNNYSDLNDDFQVSLKKARKY